MGPHAVGRCHLALTIMSQTSGGPVAVSRYPRTPTGQMPPRVASSGPARLSRAATCAYNIYSSENVHSCNVYSNIQSVARLALPCPAFAVPCHALPCLALPRLAFAICPAPPACMPSSITCPARHHAVHHLQVSPAPAIMPSSITVRKPELEPKSNYAWPARRFVYEMEPLITAATE
jgi:hypothetical protein